MAIFHVSADVISKGSAGGTAVGFARYLERTDQEYATQHRRYLERDGHDGARDLVASGSGHLPGWAKDGEHFWQMADRYERKNGLVARTYEFALPRELSPEGRLELAHDIRATFFAQYPHTWAVHCPEVHTVHGEGREKEQPHMHVMFSTRREDVASERIPAQWFRQAAPAHKDPLSGGVKKDGFWDHKATLQGLRHETAILMNAALEREGHHVAVSAESLRKQGHDRSPEYRLVKADAVLLKKYGWEIPAHLPQAQQEQLRAMHERVQTALGNREIVNRDSRGWENACARANWDWQKEREGIHDLSREAVVDHLRDRFWIHDRSPVRTKEREESLVRTTDRAYARTGRERPAPTVHIRTQEREREPARDLDRVWGRPLIGNRNSGIYHTPEHKNYGNVHPQNQERFWTERAAMEVGYRRAANDHYGPGSGQAREAAAERTHTAAWVRTKRQSQVLTLGQDRSDDMGHGAYVHLDDREHSR